MNIRELAEHIGLDVETYLQLLGLFYERSTADLKKLESALKDGSSQTIMEAAHSIKGAASSLGIQEIYEQAKEVEMMGRQNILEGVEESTIYLKKRLELMKVAMEQDGRRLQ